MKKHSSSYTSYEVITQEEEGDLLIPLPPTLLKALDWKEGDEIEINVDDKGNYVFQKANK